MMTGLLESCYRRSDAESRSISAENPTGERGGGGRATHESTLHPASARHARELGPGWKMSPCIPLSAGETFTLMDIRGSGIIRHIWMTMDPTFYRHLVLRMYWDGCVHPSVATPVGDFFCCAWDEARDVTALPVNVNPRGGLNMFLPMPFSGSARITITNEGKHDLSHLFYQIDYTLESVPEDALRLHAIFNRNVRLDAGTDYLILDRPEGRGQYIGTFMAWEQKTRGWWGEGEIKVFIDDDTEFPTICGTGTEDYFGGAWCFGRDYSAAFMGYTKISGEEGEPGTRHTMYRFHLPDPIYFQRRLRVTMQALGWQSEGRYLPLSDDISSVAFWYQEAGGTPLPALPSFEVRSEGLGPSEDANSSPS